MSIRKTLISTTFLKISPLFPVVLLPLLFLLCLNHRPILRSIALSPPLRPFTRGSDFENVFALRVCKANRNAKCSGSSFCKIPLRQYLCLIPTVTRSPRFRVPKTRFDGKLIRVEKKTARELNISSSHFAHAHNVLAVVVPALSFLWSINLTSLSSSVSIFG